GGRSPKTATAYCRVVRDFVRYHGMAHPRDLDGEAVRAYLNHLATERRVSASTQNVALNALVCLYRHVLDLPLHIGRFARAKRPGRLPTVLSREEVHALLLRLRGQNRLAAQLLYGCGLRIGELVDLRVQDVDVYRAHV